MKAHVEVEVASRRQAKAIQFAMEDPVFKATAIVVGELRQLDSDRARRRVLAFVTDELAEQNEKGADTQP